MNSELRCGCNTIYTVQDQCPTCYPPKRSLVENQSEPIPNDLPAVWDLVIEDMRSRDAVGTRRYGVRLQPFNGRDALVDAYQEALDLVVYLRTAIFERDRGREGFVE